MYPLEFKTNKKRIYSSTTYIFILWMIGSSIILFIVALIFLRNQIKPIRRLAIVVDRFGKGKDVKNFKPSGAKEIRRAAIAFQIMKERIENSILQRNKMFSSISHDIRTILTRMRFEIEKIPLNKSKQILEGIQKGCDLAGCKLVGGETAEMPGVYEDTKFDLAGFAMGVVEWEVKAPKSGDYLVGLPSSGPHSNGFSLIRKLLPMDEIPLTPTHIYTEEILHNVGEFSACAHVTGGGIHRALSRILNGLDYELDTQLPKGWWTDLYERSNMELYDFQSVFNWGWGMILATENPDRIAVKNSEVIGEIL